MPESARKLKVFLCHASQDKLIVRDLYRRLAAESWIDPWLDEEKLLPGHNWDMEIEKAIEVADAVIVFLSNNSVSKEGYVQRELRFVLDVADSKPEEMIFVIPLRLDDCPRPRRLRRWHSVDYFPADLRKATYKRLLESLNVRRETIEKVNLVSPVAKIINQKLEIWEIEEINDQQEVDLRAWQEEQTSDAAILRSMTELELKREEDEAIFASQHISPSLERLTLHGIEFCRIPAGIFLMGSANDDEDAAKNEKPQHSVNIPYDYWMARYPITNELYASYTKAQGKKHPVPEWQTKKNHPVYFVSWSDATMYCNWLNNLTRKEMPSGLVLRLPSEAEWEKAARGIDGRLYPWGNSYDDKQYNNNNKKFGTRPVGSYSPQGDSPYGCADMSGGIGEWTHSFFKPYPYDASDGRETKFAGSFRVLRSGPVYLSLWDIIFLPFDDYQDGQFGTRIVRCARRINLRGRGYAVNILSTGFRVVLAPDFPPAL